MTRILIADDHTVVRSGVRRVLEDYPGWSVVAEATNGKDAVAEAIATRPMWPSSSRIKQALTNREQTIVRLVAQGHSNKRIANLLNITLGTVETHRATVMRKLDLGSTADMVRYAIRNKLSDA